MTFSKLIHKVFGVDYIDCKIGVRYWEDATINGEEDTDGTLTPLRVGDIWAIRINLATGKIENWPHGTVADVHFKVCDAGSYYLIDENGVDVVASIENGYVPSMLCPSENGYGDYVIMHIDGNGYIQNWRADLDCFEPQDD